MDPSPEHPLLLDVTLRDGGYVIDHRWTVEEAAAIVRTVDAAGVGAIEVGYLRDRAPDPLRPSATCAPAYLAALSEQATRARLAVMVRPGEVDPQRVGAPGVGLVRVLVAGLDAERARPYLAAARAAGVPASANLTRVSEAAPAELAAAVRACAAAGADLVYLADSNGSLFPDAVRDRVAAAVEVAGVPVGFHAHDNLGLAFINTCVAVDAGAAAVDASIGGIGKGGGNLRLELIAAHWALQHRGDYRLDPLTRDRSTVAAQLRMLTDTGSAELIAGLLNLNLDHFRQFQEDASQRGFDALLAEAGADSPALGRPA